LGFSVWPTNFKNGNSRYWIFWSVFRTKPKSRNVY
jgi:hypothetical protein